jgi:hypothetical protein
MEKINYIVSYYYDCYIGKMRFAKKIFSSDFDRQFFIDNNLKDPNNIFYQLLNDNFNIVDKKDRCGYYTFEEVISVEVKNVTTFLIKSGKEK